MLRKGMSVLEAMPRSTGLRVCGSCGGKLKIKPADSESSSANYVCRLARRSACRLRRSKPASPLARLTLDTSLLCANDTNVPIDTIILIDV
jgi:hypothetical protein